MLRPSARATLPYVLALLAATLLLPANAFALDDSEAGHLLASGVTVVSQDDADSAEADDSAGSIDSTTAAEYVTGCKPSIDYNPVPYGNVAVLSAVAPKSVGSRAFSYEWQRSTDNGATWTDAAVNGAQTLHVSTDAVHVGNLYRVIIVLEDGNSEPSDSVEIVQTVLTASLAVSLDYVPPIAGDWAVFYARVIAPDTLDPSTLAYRWEQSADSAATWNVIPGETSSVLKLKTDPIERESEDGSSAGDAQLVYIRAVVTAGSESATSSPQPLTVRPQDEAGENSGASGSGTGGASSSDDGLTSFTQADVTGIVDKTYNGRPQTQDITVKIGDAVLVEGVDYKVTYASNINAGYGCVEVEGIGKYSGGIGTTFKINPLAMSSAKLSASSFIYTGKVQKPSVASVMAGSLRVDPSDYDIEYSDSSSKAAGTYTVLVTGSGNVTGTKLLTYKINPAKVTSASLSKNSFTYTGKVQKPGVKAVKAGSMSLGKSDYGVEYSNAKSKAAGTYTVLVAGEGNFTGMKLATYTIEKAPNKAVAKKTSVRKSLKAKNLRKKALAIVLPKVTAKFGTAKWKVANKDKKKVLSLKAGKVQVKKGAKKGTYTIKIKASVKGTKNYSAASTKKVTVRVTVK